jgi:hypothetical protein
MGFAVEADDPAMVDDLVNDGGVHVAVAKHVASPVELDVADEDEAHPFARVRSGQVDLAATDVPMEH